MDRFLHLISRNKIHIDAHLLLAATWLLGLISGAMISIYSGDSHISLMRMAVSGHVSIFGLCPVILLPLLFSAFAVYISQHWLLIPIAFLKAFLFAYVGIGVMLAFDCSGWLVRFLLMFSDAAMMPLLYWFWSRNLSVKGSLSFQTAGCLVLGAVLIGGVDCYFVSPFLTKVLSL